VLNRTKLTRTHANGQQDTGRESTNYCRRLRSRRTRTPNAPNTARFSPLFRRPGNYDELRVRTHLIVVVKWSPSRHVARFLSRTRTSIVRFRAVFSSEFVVFSTNAFPQSNTPWARSPAVPYENYARPVFRSDTDEQCVIVVFDNRYGTSEDGNVRFDERVLNGFKRRVVKARFPRLNVP